MGTIKFNGQKLEIDHLELDPRTSDPMVIDMITEHFAPFVCRAVGAEKLSLTIKEETEELGFYTEEGHLSSKKVSIGWSFKIEPWTGYHVRIEYRGNEITL
jgi:hypothetical protein